MKNCPICKVITVLAGVGALNWGLVAFLNMNLVEKILGTKKMTNSTFIIPETTPSKAKFTPLKKG